MKDETENGPRLSASRSEANASGSVFLRRRTPGVHAGWREGHDLYGGVCGRDGWGVGQMYLNLTGSLAMAFSSKVKYQRVRGVKMQKCGCYSYKWA